MLPKAFALFPEKTLSDQEEASAAKERDTPRPRAQRGRDPRLSRLTLGPGEMCHQAYQVTRDREAGGRAGSQSMAACEVWIVGIKE